MTWRCLDRLILAFVACVVMLASANYPPNNQQQCPCTIPVRSHFCFSLSFPYNFCGFFPSPLFGSGRCVSLGLQWLSAWLAAAVCVRHMWPSTIDEHQREPSLSFESALVWHRCVQCGWRDRCVYRFWAVHQQRRRNTQREMPCRCWVS